ncbi:unnamed protein product [Caenorhabditis angaria]|uniref:BTB domain-containing protein n=1 Tax=Caenorhabditis angaria TaxID=860376 RepID=A0A9P1IFM2_9PELO|nr:unnamed protein product [Caenorhabditis angaria]
MIPFQSLGNTLRWKFEKFSSLGKEERFSDVFSIGPTSWKIAVCIDSYLSIRLYYDSENKNEKNWFCETEATFKLLRQSGTGKNNEKIYSNAYNYLKLSSGYPKFESWNTVYHYGFQKNDSIIVEINLNFVFHDFSKKIDNFTDIIVNVENTEFNLNKGVLCSKSKYFYDLFITQKSTESAVKLDNITAKDFFYVLMQFNPNLKIIKENNDFETLFKIAKDFGVQSLHQLYEQYLISDECDFKIIQKVKIAEENGYEFLMKSCIESLKTVADVRNVQIDGLFSELKETTRWRIMMRVLDFV